MTGNVDKPGACVLAEGPDFVSGAGAWRCATRMPAPERRARGAEHAPIVRRCSATPATTRCAQLTEQLGPHRSRMRYLTSAHAAPGAACHGGGASRIPCARSSCRRRTRCSPTATPRACDGLIAALDLLVVLEYRLTPTAHARRLRAAQRPARMERPVLQVHGGVANMPATAGRRPWRRTTSGGATTTCSASLGRAPGAGGRSWPEETLEDAFASQLLPAGLSWEEFCIEGTYWPRPAYAKHEALGADGRPVGFATTTGRIELASEFLPSPRRQPPARARAWGS